MSLLTRPFRNKDEVTVNAFNHLGINYSGIVGCNVMTTKKGCCVKHTCVDGNCMNRENIQPLIYNLNTVTYKRRTKPKSKYVLEFRIKNGNKEGLVFVGVTKDFKYLFPHLPQPKTGPVGCFLTEGRFNPLIEFIKNHS